MQGDEELWGTPVIRTDFADEAAWVAVCAALQEPDAESGYEADVACRSDPRYAGLTAEGVAALLPHDQFTFMFIVDHLTLTHPEHPLLAVDLGDAPTRSFRTIPSEVAAIAGQPVAREHGLRRLRRLCHGDVARRNPPRLSVVLSGAEPQSPRPADGVGLPVGQAGARLTASSHRQRATLCAQ